MPKRSRHVLHEALLQVAPEVETRRRAFQRQHQHQGLEVDAALHAAGEEAATSLSGRARYARRECGGGAGAVRRDPGAVHHRVAHAGLDLVEDHSPVMYGRPRRGVAGIAADPLDSADFIAG
jgi:hypothetical protein